MNREECMIIGLILLAVIAGVIVARWLNPRATSPAPDARPSG